MAEDVISDFLPLVYAKPTQLFQILFCEIPGNWMIDEFDNQLSRTFMGDSGAAGNIVEGCQELFPTHQLGSRITNGEKLLPGQCNRCLVLCLKVLPIV
ncbi:hypothetical protein CCX46_13030 [Pseudomonas sp. RU47]|nr:hypothetical protein CCX46_13030 [Pseudomonas sp. RU47]